MSDAATRLNAALEGRYRIERELGEGGMATVYLADDLKHERKVALKVLKPELAAVVGAERFLTEIKTTANLQHPHILALFDSGEADGFLFYVMPYVEGESLQEKLEREKQLPVDDAVRIATEIADALDYAHGRGVVHRDIKPANILLQSGRVLVADFGIALAISEAGGGRLTETGLSMGTPLYMSPEQATGDRDIDGRSDLYSLACITYEMLAGDPPWAASTAQAILAKLLTEEVKPLSEVRPSVPSHVEAAVHRALEKLPADRPQRAASFAEDLRTARAALRAVAVSTEKRPWLVPAGLTAALLGLVGAGWILFGGGLATNASIEQSVAVMPCKDLSAPDVPTPLTQGFAEEIIVGLTKLPDLRVINVASVIELLARKADIETIGETLNVATVLECTLQLMGETVRVRAQLVEAATGDVLWALESIDGPAADLFSIQDSVARAVADQLQVVLAVGEDTPLVAQATTVPGAHDAYMLGRYLWNQRTGESVLAAIEQFDRAVRLDSTYAEAYIGLADSYLVLDYYTEDVDFATHIELGLDAARTANKLSPDLGETHAAVAWGLFGQGHWDEAEEEFEAAIALSPGYASGHQWFGNLLRYTGRAEAAIAHHERAVELDPLSKVISLELGRALLISGRIEEAVQRFEETTLLDRNWGSGWWDLAQARLLAGNYPGGRAAWDQFIRLGHTDDAPREAARAGYEALIRHHQTGEVQTFPAFPLNLQGQFFQYAGTGQLDRANDAFEALLRNGAYALLAKFRSVPRPSDALDNDPRYQSLLEEAGITW